MNAAREPDDNIAQILWRALKVAGHKLLRWRGPGQALGEFGGYRGKRGGAREVPGEPSEAPGEPREGPS